VKPTRRSFYRHVGARVVSDGGVLSRDLIVVVGSVRWTGNLSDQANVAARGGAVVARGKTDITFWRHVMAHGISELAKIAQIHRFAGGGHGSGAIGSGSNCRRSSKGR
jgi:hypothetical protein